MKEILPLVLTIFFLSENLNAQAAQVHVRKIEIQGNRYTQDKFIRREMLLAEGDVLRPTLLQESVQRISQLGLFERVEAKIVPLPESHQADIVIEVEEKKLYELRGGFGFGQQEGFSGNVEFLTRNLLSSGIVLDLFLEKGPHVAAYSLDLMKPYFLDSRVTLAFSLYIDRTDFFNYIVGQDISGGSISATISLPHDFHALIGFQKQYRDFNTDASNLLSEADSGTEHRLVLQTVKKKESGAPGDSEQNKLRWNLLLAGGPFGGEANYVKSSAKILFFLPSFRQPDHFLFGLQGGYASGFSNKELPVFERFYLGGVDTLRGYETGQVGPVQLTQISSTMQNVVVGGNKFAVFNLEYSHSLMEGLEIVPFLDYGNAFAAGKRIDFTDMPSSAGLEVRILIPWIRVPLRFIQAWNFNRGDLDLLPEATRSRSSMFRISLGRVI